MKTTLTLIPLLAAWALLHRTSRRPGWGYVGVPPTPLQIRLRRFTRAFVRANREFAEELTPTIVAATEAMRRLSAALGADVLVGPFVEIQAGVTVGELSKIESHSFICTGVTIGARVFIGHGAMFTNDRHPRVEGYWALEPTAVEDDASIGTGAVILPGVTICSGALVGAGAVVTRDVEAGAVVAGVPARVIGRRVT